MQAVPEKVMLSKTESPNTSPRADPSVHSTRHSMTQEAAVEAVSGFFVRQVSRGSAGGGGGLAALFIRRPQADQQKG